MGIDEVGMFATKWAPSIRHHGRSIGFIRAGPVVDIAPLLSDGVHITAPMVTPDDIQS
jgi:hypothetical protein